MHIESEFKLGFKDVFIRPKRSTLKSRSEVSLNRKYTFRNSGYAWEGLPIMAANMDTIGTFSMAKALYNHQMFTVLHKHYKAEDLDIFFENNLSSLKDYISLSTGISNNEFEFLKTTISKHPLIKFICIDVANGYTEQFVSYVKRVREAFPDKVIIAGNVVTGEMVEELLISGADIIKVGIGPGSVCTTRLKAGVGYPQISAIIECADAAHGLKGHIIADGGCTCPGDVAKAFGAGADFVMLGGMLAGHNECDGEKLEIDNNLYMEFYGMSSDNAMKKHHGGTAKYRASEGKVVRVPFRGDVDNTIQDILGGVRSACTYVGATSLRELFKRTTFVKVKEQENQVFSD